MVNNLLVEPDDLRKSAEQHDVIAKELREKGAIPQAWLDEFPETHGTIAAPMYKALVDFYNDRHAKAERLARKHEQTRDQLLKAADDLEAKDGRGRQQIVQAGDGFDNHPGVLGPNTPSIGALPPMPISPTPHPGGTPPRASVPPLPGERTPNPAAAPPTQHHVRPDDPAAAGAPTSTIAPVGGTGPVGSSTPVGLSTPVGPVIPNALTPRADSNAQMRSFSRGSDISADATTTPPRIAASGNDTRAANGANPSPVAPERTVVTNGASARLRPELEAGPLSPGPLAASARNAGSERSRPSLVVGDTVVDHLTLARTLLAAVLAAVGDSTPGLEWATAVAITPRGPVLLLTSTEGRGWLPAGLFLPSEVIVPWRWKSRFSDSHQRAVAKLAGIDDPARMLAELLSIATARISIRLSALASSTTISDRLRASLPGDVAVTDQVTAALADTDFSRPGAGLVDRLEIAGTDNTRRYSEMTPDMEIREVCRKLLIDTRIQVRAGGRMQDAFVRRRTNELRRLYSDTEPDRQVLRDMLYTYEHIVTHNVPEGATMPQITAGAGEFRSEMSN